MKKLILPIAAIAMASFVACGDDSSPSSSSSSPKQDTLPASVEKFFDLDNNYTCSQTVNKCATVQVVGYSRLLRVQWFLAMFRVSWANALNSRQAVPKLLRWRHSVLA